jgi:hypothetical protein
MRHLRKDSDYADSETEWSFASPFMKMKKPPIQPCHSCSTPTRATQRKTGVPECWCCANPQKPDEESAVYFPRGYVPATAEDVYAWIDLRAAIVARGGYVIAEIGKRETDKMFQVAARLKIHVPLYNHRRGKKNKKNYDYKRKET